MSLLYNCGPAPTHLRNINDKKKFKSKQIALKDPCTEGSTQTSGIFSTGKSLDKVFTAYKNPWKSILGTDWNLLHFLWEPE